MCYEQFVLVSFMTSKENTQEESIHADGAKGDVQAPSKWESVSQ